MDGARDSVPRVKYIFSESKNTTRGYSKKTMGGIHFFRKQKLTRGFLKKTRVEYILLELESTYEGVGIKT